MQESTKFSWLNLVFNATASPKEKQEKVHIIIILQRSHSRDSGKNNKPKYTPSLVAHHLKMWVWSKLESKTCFLLGGRKSKSLQPWAQRPEGCRRSVVAHGEICTVVIRGVTAWFQEVTIKNSFCSPLREPVSKSVHQRHSDTSCSRTSYSIMRLPISGSKTLQGKQKTKENR